MLIHQLLNKKGCPIFSTPPSTKPRNMIQNASSKTAKKRKFIFSIKLTSFVPPQSNLERLIDRCTKRFFHSCSHCGNFRQFIYRLSLCRKTTEGYWVVMLHAKDNNSWILGLETTFKSCNMWVPDTFYCNKQLLSSRTKGNPVRPGPVIMCYTKDVEIFSTNFS